MINEFKKIAPYITASVKEKLAEDANEAAIIEAIHREIMSFFSKQNAMCMEYLTFSQEQRLIFSESMYDLLKPMASEVKQSMNPVYIDYVKRSGKTGAKNFITNA